MTHESNGIDIITALILNDISPLCKYRMDLVLQLKVGARGERVAVRVSGEGTWRAWRRGVLYATVPLVRCAGCTGYTGT